MTQIRQKKEKAGVAYYLHGVKPRVSRYLELVVLREGGILVPLAFQTVQVRVDHPVTITYSCGFALRRLWRHTNNTVERRNPFSNGVSDVFRGERTTRNLRARVMTAEHKRHQQQRRRRQQQQQ